MGLLRDWTLLEDATRIPALSEMVREALIRALFARDDRVLPRAIVAALSKSPAVTIKIKDDGEVRKLIAVLNGEESTANLGFSAEDYHYFRKHLNVGRDQVIGVVPKPRSLLTYDWIVPEPRGVQLDFSAYADIEFAGGGHCAIAQAGATWKQLHDAALEKGHLVPFVPTVPVDFALTDALWSDASFSSYDAEFPSYVHAIRTISAYGHRTRIGFEDVSTEGSGYDLLHTILPHAAEFFVPVALALRLLPKPPGRRTLTYLFDDGAKLSAGLDKLTRSGRTAIWVHVRNATASAVLRPGPAQEPFSVQMSLGGSETNLATREKAMDGILAGFKSKSTDVPNPFDVPADAYRKAAERVARGVFVGEVRLPVRAYGDLHAKVQGLAEQAGTKVALYAAVRGTGTASAFPAFEGQKDRTRIFELSKGIDRVVRTIPGALFVSRLAHLWRDDKDYLRRMSLLRDLKLEIDAARVIQPLASR